MRVGVLSATAALISLMAMFASPLASAKNEGSEPSVDSAFLAYGEAKECRKSGIWVAKLTGENCIEDACPSIAKQVAWLGAVCVADFAKEKGDGQDYQAQLRRAFKLFGKAHSRRELAAIPGFARVEDEAGDSELWQYSAESFFREQIEPRYKSLKAQKQRAEREATLAPLKARAEAGEAQAQFELGDALNDYWVRDAQGEGMERPEEAAQWYRKAAEQGHAKAQFALGRMYEQGQGLSKDEIQSSTWPALAWYAIAAKQGHAGAQGRAGGMSYDLGNYAEALDMSQKAAAQGDAHGQYVLGLMYANGKGVPKDDAQAVGWFRKAAEQRHANAQGSLGWAYASGTGVAKDPAQAVIWYRKAAEQDNAAAQFNLGLVYTNGEGVAKDPVEAVTWYRKAAEHGYADAQLNLGWMYESGEGVTKDATEAMVWYRKAAEQGHAGAQTNLGWMYGNGEGVSKDDAQAVLWYRKAAEQGHARAEYSLGLMYDNGEAVAKDAALAAGWYRKAAEQGHKGAQNNLGVAFEQGSGVLQDYIEAASWYRKAATQGEKYAQRNLAKLYWRGLGVPQSLVTAYAWMNLSAAAGHENAPAERDQIAAQMSAADIQKAQSLSRAWKAGQLIPEVKATARAVSAAKPAARPAQPVAQQTSSSYPARPAKKPGVVSCNTNCRNGDCYRTYDDGEQVHFQAQRKFNAFGEFEWDSGGC